MKPDNPFTVITEASAAELARRHAKREQFRPLAGDPAVVDIDAAYAIQDAFVARTLRSRNTTVRGNKVALTNVPKQEILRSN